MVIRNTETKNNQKKSPESGTNGKTGTFCFGGFCIFSTKRVKEKQDGTISDG